MQTDRGSDQPGIRILRAGGSDCPDDTSRQMSFTVDIWCDQNAKDQPQNIQSSADPEDTLGESDSCNVYVSMVHAAGCVYYDFTPILQVTGAFMIFFGLLLMICGMRA